MTIFIGDSLTWLKKLPSESVHCIVTSPPYYGLRDYGIAGQIGLEETPEMFIDKLVTLFREARRVLRADGTCWVNMGDSYATSVNGRSADETKAIGNDDRTFRDKPFSTVGNGYKPKDLMMMPARLALALQADGWWLRSDIIWHKPNPMPESVTDRPTKSHEHIFLLAKSERYWYDAGAIREPSSPDDSRERSFRNGDNSTLRKDNGREYQSSGTRNKRDVWTIPTQAFPEAHFATFPMELAATCIKAGCPETVCSECGAGYVPIVESKRIDDDKPSENLKLQSAEVFARGGNQGTYGRIGNYDKTHHGYEPSCTCNAATDNGVVLDPFGGAGTTAIAAVHLGRKYQLIELNPRYVGIAQKRIADYNPFQDTVLPDGKRQLSLFSMEGIA